MKFCYARWNLFVYTYKTELMVWTNIILLKFIWRQIKHVHACTHSHRANNQDSYWIYIRCFGSLLSSHDPISLLYTFNFNWFSPAFIFQFVFFPSVRSFPLSLSLSFSLWTCRRYVSLRWINDGLAGHWSIARWFDHQVKLHTDYRPFGTVYLCALCSLSTICDPDHFFVVIRMLIR